MTRRTDRRHRGLAIRLVVSAVSVLLASGCSGMATEAVTGQAAPVTAGRENEASAPVLPASRPVRLRIPSLNVDNGQLLELGLQPDGTMEVPPDASQVGWYVNSPTPGELGPAVLAAHVDWKGVKGPFYFLHTMTPGQEIEVQREDGTTGRFRVLKIDKYPKAQFPTDQVYGDVATAQLRLITCGGTYDKAAATYEDNIVVYAELDPATSGTA